VQSEFKTALGVKLQSFLQLGVASAQDGGKTSRFHFATTPFARLLEMPMIADFLQHAFTVQFLFQPAQSFINGFAFFESDLGQELSHPLYALDRRLSPFLALKSQGSGA
jgi:hypothetical protein